MKEAHMGTALTLWGICLMLFILGVFAGVKALKESHNYLWIVKTALTINVVGALYMVLALP